MITTIETLAESLSSSVNMCLCRIMALKFRCSDIGFDCGLVAKGKCEDEILARCSTHATQGYKMKPKEINDELKSKIRANVHKSWF